LAQRDHGVNPSRTTSRYQTSQRRHSQQDDWRYHKGERIRRLSFIEQTGEQARKSDYNQAIVLNPRLAEAWGNRGLVRLAKGDFDEAIADCARAIEINPRIAEIYNNRGAARHQEGD